MGRLDRTSQKNPQDELLQLQPQWPVPRQQR